MKYLMIAAGLALLVAASTPPARAKVAKSAPAEAPSPSVRDVATDPAAHLGHLALAGVVGIVTPRKGFVLVDLKEYREEGFACLTTDEPTKIAVQWTGAAPKVRERVQVDGKLVKGRKGYAFIADKVTRE